MQILDLLLPALLLASPIACRVRGGGANIGAHVARDVFSDDEGPNNAPETTTCSANDAGDVPDWARNGAWLTNMTSCLNQLNNDGWNGVECQPALADGTKLGPSFGFYKGKDNWNGADDSGSSCYTACSACLLDGLNQLQAQTTSCVNVYTTKLGVSKHECYMGFNYGK